MVYHHAALNKLFTFEPCSGSADEMLELIGYRNQDVVVPQ